MDSKMTTTTNSLVLNCVLHGTYQKFESDQDKACPNCRKQIAEAEDIQFLNRFKVTESIFVEVKIQCEIHGEIKLNAPKLFAHKFEHCPKCIEEKRQGKMKKHVEKYIDQVIKESGLPMNTVGMSFSELDRTKSEKQTRIIERLVVYICDMVKAGHSTGAKNIIFSGNMGTGKSLFASLVLQNIARRSLGEGIKDKNDIFLKAGLGFTFISEQMLISAITASWSDNAVEKTHKLIERLSTKAILCIDDVGTVTNTQTHLLDAYATIIDERYKRNLPTIITSNMSHESLKLAIGARAADRFLEKNKVIVANFDWQGYRTATQGSNEIEIF